MLTEVHRISSRPEDGAAHTLWARLRSLGAQVEILLDGRHQRYVRAADVPEGTIVRVGTDAEGRIRHDGDSVAEETLSGSVEIRVRWPRPSVTI